MVKNQKGFSLVELMIVVAIIGILSAIALPNFKRFQYKAMQAEAKNQLASLYTAEKAFYSEWSQYFADLQNVGYQPDGRPRYDVGFNAAGAVNAPANYTGAGVAAGAAAVNFDTLLLCNATTCPHITPASGTAPSVPLAAAVVGSATTFRAAAGGDIASNTTTDVWSMDQDKVLTNDTTGFN